MMKQDLVRFAGSVFAPLFGPLDRVTLHRVGEREMRLARAIRNRNAYAGEPTVREIERRRAEMLASQELLIDGSIADDYEADSGKTLGTVTLASKPQSRALLLYSLAREFLPATILELGTNVGISSAYLAAAVPSASVMTLEGSKYRAQRARELHGELGLTNIEYRTGNFVDTLEPALRAMAPVEMAFIDGHHQYQPTLDYFEAILAQAAEDCVYVFDDIRWSRGMIKAWREVSHDPRVSLSVDIGWAGICIAKRMPAAKSYRSMPMLSLLA